jgi:hypothetical protein
MKRQNLHHQGTKNTKNHQVKSGVSLVQLGALGVFQGDFLPGILVVRLS